MDLNDKTALVTGGSRGIGKAIATRLASDGALVAVHYGTGHEAAAQTVSEIAAAGGTAFPLGAVLGKEGDAQQLWTDFDALVTEHTDRAGVDILVNNAGVTTRGGVDSATPEGFDEAFAVDVRAPFFIVQEALKGRLHDRGRVITIGSALTRVARPDTTVYSMAKAAMTAFTSNLAEQLGPRGITVNLVSPGVTVTDINRDWLQENPDAQAETVSRIALNRLGQPEDIADVVAFVASDDARWVTAQNIEASGGLVLGF